MYSLTDLENREIYHILQVIYTAHYQERSFQVCNALLEALVGLIEPQLTQTVRSRYVQMLQQSIIHGFEDPAFSLEAACTQIPQNIDHLRRNFKKCMGITPHQYLTQLRIEKAKHLLTETPERKLYLWEIANRSGFADPSYFSKVFKKWTGKTPVQWQ